MAEALPRDLLLGLTKALHDAYGAQHWWPGNSRFEIAVGAILVQNTSWSNAARAIARLAQCDLLRPAALLGCDEERLGEIIRPSGIYRQKARRLLTFARWLQREGGFRSLEAWTTARLRASLLALHGIGPETADSILLYALERSVFVVDAYTLRVLGRLGYWNGSPAGIEPLRAGVMAAMGDDVRFFNEFHALMVEHGKRVCRPQPRCGECVLRTVCRSGSVTQPAV